MGAAALAVLFFVATLTAAISATIGMAGGIILLSVLTAFVSMREAVPLHGFAQFFSNIGRLASYFRSIEWRMALPFVLAALPGALVGVKAMTLLDQVWVELAVGLLIGGFVLWPRSPHAAPPVRGQWFFAGLGFGSAAIGMIAGATGPMIAPFFMQSGLEKRRLVATKACCQSMVQFVKLPFFWAFAGFSFEMYWELLVLFVIASLIGAYLGSRLIDRISDHLYHRIIKWTVALLALRMSIGAGWALAHRGVLWHVS